MGGWLIELGKHLGSPYIKCIAVSTRVLVAVVETGALAGGDKEPLTVTPLPLTADVNSPPECTQRCHHA